jgi:hypothetical protein
MKQKQVLFILVGAIVLMLGGQLSTPIQRSMLQGEIAELERAGFNPKVLERHLEMIHPVTKGLHKYPIGRRAMNIEGKNVDIPTVTIDLRGIDTNEYAWKYRYLTSVPVSGTQGYRLLGGDFDSNGWGEVYGYYLRWNQADSKSKIYEFNGNNWTERFLFPFSVGTIDHIADIDRNGLQEIYTAYSYWVFAFEQPSRDGLPTYLKFAFRRYSRTAIAIPGEMADVNNDDVPDYIYPGSDSTTYTIKTCIAKYDSFSQNLTRVSAKQLPPYVRGIDSCTLNIAVGDFDCDAHKEIVTSSFTGNTYVMEHVERDSFSVVWNDSIPPAGRVAAGDVDGNGIEEFFVGGTRAEADGYVHMKIVVRERTADNQYAIVAGIDIFPVASFSSDRYEAVDVDGDGKLELLISNKAANVIIKGIGPRRYSLFYYKSVRYSDGFSVGDITSDGIPELFMGRFIPGQEVLTQTDVYALDSTLTDVQSNRDVADKTQFALSQNYPNPFNDQTAIRFSLTQRGHVRLKIFDMSGREITTLIDGEKQPGNYTTSWNGKSKGGGESASGFYICQLNVGAKTLVRKMLLVK